MRSLTLCGTEHRHAWLPQNLFSSACHPNFPFVLGGAGHYDTAALQLLIHNLKFRSLSIAAEPLGDLLVRYVRLLELDLAGQSFTVMPIPLSRRRRRARGYNQAELIARRFADELALPLDARTLIRARHAKPQSDILNVAERRENIRGAFTVTNDACLHDTVCGKNIILIDYVSTTGSTFYEAALVLKAAGAGTIIALAVAKT